MSVVGGWASMLMHMQLPTVGMWRRVAAHPLALAQHTAQLCERQAMQSCSRTVRLPFRAVCAMTVSQVQSQGLHPAAWPAQAFAITGSKPQTVVSVECLKWGCLPVASVPGERLSVMLVHNSVGEGQDSFLST